MSAEEKQPLWESQFGYDPLPHNTAQPAREKQADEQLARAELGEIGKLVGRSEISARSVYEHVKQQLAEARAQAFKEATAKLQPALAIMPYQHCMSCNQIAFELQLAVRAIELAQKDKPAPPDAPKCPKCGSGLCQPYKSTETGLWTQRCDKCPYFDSWAGLERV